MNETTSTLGVSTKSDEPSRKLIAVVGSSISEHVLPEEGVVVIGRDASADVVIDHKTLSRRHVKLSISANVTVEDLGSRNGTTLSGRKLSAGEVVLVAPGASLELGDALVVVRHAGGGADALGTQDGNETGQGNDALQRRLARIAATDIGVLIVGESGSGKTFTAERIHALSPRKGGPFIALHCTHAVGAEAIASAIASARGGTLFVHQPSELTYDNQILLASAIASAKSAELRVLASTTRDLKQLESRGDFATELLHRLSTLTLLVPPLRARIRELAALAEQVAAGVAADNGRPAPLVTAEALAVLERHAWPGNVRELKNVLTRAVLLGKGRVLTASHFTFEVEQAAGAAPGTLSSAISDAEYRRIVEVLRQCDGNQTRAAKMLGISRGTLLSRLQRYAIPRPRK